MSRIRRYEDRKAQKKLGVAIVGSFGLVIFLGIFGLKILVGFSVLVDKIRGNSPSSQTNQSNLLLAPVLDPLPEATHSATLTITGKATPKTQLILYLNDSEYKKISVSDDGTFSVADIPVEEGMVRINSKLVDEKGNSSDLSNILSTIIDHKPPTLTISKPDDGAKIQDGTHKATIEGITDTESRVTINDRIVVVRGDGSFVYTIAITDGENALHIVAVDPAGNRVTNDRRVIYQN